MVGSLEWMKIKEKEKLKIDYRQESSGERSYTKVMRFQQNNFKKDTESLVDFFQLIFENVEKITRSYLLPC